MNQNRPEIHLSGGTSGRTMMETQLKTNHETNNKKKSDSSSGGPSTVTVRAQTTSAPRVAVKPPKDRVKTMEYDGEKLAHEVKALRDKVRRLETMNDQLKQREKDLSDRLSSEAQRHVVRSGKFENLSQETMRLSQLVERYELLYTQGRLDALDDLDQIKELSKLPRQNEIKPKIVLAIIVASYRLSKDYSKHVRRGAHQLLSIPENTAQENGAKNSFAEMTQYIHEYLQSTTNKFDIEPIVRGVTDQLKDVLPDYSNLDRMHGLTRYTCECARLTWAMCNQNPPLEIDCTAEMYNAVTHTRFHNSNDKGFWVKTHVWPALIDSVKKNVLYRGVVVT